MRGERWGQNWSGQVLWDMDWLSSGEGHRIPQGEGVRGTNSLTSFLPFPSTQDTPNVVVQSLSHVWLCDPMDRSMPLSPGPCSNSCPSSWWCHPTISSSVTLFSSCPQSFPASGSFPLCWLFASGGKSITASASVLPMNIQGCFPLGLTGLISLLAQGTLKSLLHGLATNSQI